jgi:hypothetical protein
MSRHAICRQLRSSNRLPAVADRWHLLKNAGVVFEKNIQSQLEFIEKESDRIGTGRVW